MRILLVGDRTQAPVRIITRLLEEKGHDVGVHIPHRPDESSLGRLRNSFGRGRNVALLRALVAKWKPDCVHVVGEKSFPTQSLCLIARQANVRTLWSVSDYSPLCPVGSCRTPDGAVCEECMHGARHIMVKRCVGKKTVPSFIGLLDNMYWDVSRLARVADTVAVTSEFMRSKWLEAGFPSQRVKTLPLPVAHSNILNTDRQDFYCFTGHLSPESGVETLVRAAVATDAQLVVAGIGELLPRLKDLASHSPLIHFVDDINPDIITCAKAVVVPSESYIIGEDEVKQALCAGTPVIASAIAGLPEMIHPQEGVTFTPGSTEELATVLREFDKRHAFCHDSISRRNTEKYSEDIFYNKLIKLYQGC